MNWLMSISKSEAMDSDISFKGSEGFLTITFLLFGTDLRRSVTDLGEIVVMSCDIPDHRIPPRPRDTEMFLWHIEYDA